MYRNNKALRRYRSNDSGGIAILTGIALVAFIAFVSLAMNVVRAYRLQNDMQQASDIGSVAGAITMALEEEDKPDDAKIRQISSKYYKANIGKILKNERGDWSANLPENKIGINRSERTVTVSPDGSIPKFFTGGERMAVASPATAIAPERQFPDLEVALAFDITTSMVQGGGSYNPKKLEDAKKAATLMINALYERKRKSNDVFISIVPFSSTVRLNFPEAPYDTWMNQDALENVVDSQAIFKDGQREAGKIWNGCIINNWATAAEANPDMSDITPRKLALIPHFYNAPTFDLAFSIVKVSYLAMPPKKYAYRWDPAKMLAARQEETMDDYMVFVERGMSFATPAPAGGGGGGGGRGPSGPSAPPCLDCPPPPPPPQEWDRAGRNALNRPGGERIRKPRNSRPGAIARGPRTGRGLGDGDGLGNGNGNGGGGGGGRGVPDRFADRDRGSWGGTGGGGAPGEGGGSWDNANQGGRPGIGGGLGQGNGLGKGDGDGLGSGDCNGAGRAGGGGGGGGSGGGGGGGGGINGFGFGSGSGGGDGSGRGSGFSMHEGECKQGNNGGNPDRGNPGGRDGNKPGNGSPRPGGNGPGGNTAGNNMIPGSPDSNSPFQPPISGQPFGKSRSVEEPAAYCMLPAIKPLTNKQAELIQHVNSFKITIEDNNRQANFGVAGTIGQFGMLWAWRTLSPDWAGLWSIDKTPQDRPAIYGKDKKRQGKQTYKSIILLTDGKGEMPETYGAYGNTLAGIKSPNEGKAAFFDREFEKMGRDPLLYETWARYDWMSHGLKSKTYEESDKELDQKLAQLCKVVKKETPITVFTVGFDLKNSGKDAKDLLTKCATKPEYAFMADDGQSLEKAFGRIVDELAELKIRVIR